MTKRKYINTSFMIWDMRTSFSLCSRADFRNSSSGGLFGEKMRGGVLLHREFLLQLVEMQVEIKITEYNAHFKVKNYVSPCYR